MEAKTNETVRSRLAHELKVYFVISAYLFVCFSIVMLYDASQSTAADAPLLNLGLAVVKALVLGKFILIGEMLKPGTRIGASHLLHRIAWRTLALLAVLVVFKVLEELVIGLVHGQSIADIVAEIGDMTWLAVLGPILLLMLILIPLVTATELDRALGDNGLKGILLRSE